MTRPKNTHEKSPSSQAVGWLVLIRTEAKRARPGRDRNERRRIRGAPGGTRCERVTWTRGLEGGGLEEGGYSTCIISQVAVN